MELLPFQLPSELLLASLFAQYPCRETQIRSLAILLSPSIASTRNIVLYGLEATGKSAIVSGVLSLLAEPQDYDERDGIPMDRDPLRYAIVKSAECITGRHLFEATVGAVAEAVGWRGDVGRCENVAQLVVVAGNMLDSIHPKTGVWGETGGASKFVLVFDGIDRQRDAPPTLLAALARLAEIIPNLTVIFIVTSPRSHFLHISNVSYLQFPSYTKAESIKILSQSPPPLFPFSEHESLGSPASPKDPKIQQGITDFWLRFCSAVWDTLSKHSGRDILSFRTVCLRLWSPFTAPIRDGTYGTKDFARILVSKRPLLQGENVLVPSIISTSSAPSSQPQQNGAATSTATATANKIKLPSLSTQLPFTSRLLLVAAYLASYTPPRTDVLLYSKGGARGRRKKGGGTMAPRSRPGTSKHRKISRKLLGPQAWVLERMLAIFCVVQNDAGATGFGGGKKMTDGNTADVGMSIATLASLRLLVRVGGSSGADVLDAGCKWKVNVGWEVVRGVARSVGVEVEDYLTD